MRETLKEVLVCSPTRVDLSGGTLDLWPLYLFFQESFVVNFSIDLYTQVKIKEKKDASIYVNVLDFKYKKKFSNIKSLLKLRGEKESEKKGVHQRGKDPLSFLIPHFEYWMPKKGFSIKTFSQSPLKSGIGSSSSLCISLIKSFSTWLNHETLRDQDMIRLASNIEAKGLGFPTGTQDYLPALQPGLHIIQYGLKGGLFLKKLKSQWQETFKKNTLLISTGISHDSALLNWDIYRSFLEGDRRVVDGLRGISGLSSQVARACLKEKWEDLPSLMEEEFLLRLKMSKSFANARILGLREEILKRGGESFKLCGAGGGGVAFVWVSSIESRKKILFFLKKHSIRLLSGSPIGEKVILSFYN